MPTKVRSGAWWRVAMALVAIALLANIAAAAVPECAESRLAERATRIDALRRALLTVRDEDPTVVPLAASRNIELLKDQLVALGAEQVACVPPGPADASAVIDRLARRVPEQLAGVDAAGDFQQGSFGTPITFQVRREEGGRPRLVVLTMIGIPCAADTLLSIFEIEDGQWVERLRWRAKPYDSVGGAHWQLQYALSPVAADGAWHVLVSHLESQCFSTWTTIHYAVLRPGSIPDVPQVLLDENHSVWWGDDAGVLAADARGVELRYYDMSIDLVVYGRRSIRRYEFAGGRLVRVQPVAESPRDFVDEWIQSDWDEAQAWTATSERVRATLLPLHEQLRDHFRDGLAFGAVRGCTDGAAQVAIDRADGTTAWYVRVVPLAVGHELAAIRATTESQCEVLLTSPEPLGPSE